MSPDDVASRRAAREARARGGLPPVPRPGPDPALDPAAAAGRAILEGQTPTPAPARRARRARRATSPDEFTAELVAHPPQILDGMGTRPLNVQIPTDVLGDLGAYCTRTGRSRREVVHALLLQLLGPHDGTVGGKS